MGTTTKEFVAWFKDFGDDVSEMLASVLHPMDDTVVDGFPKISHSIHSTSKQQRAPRLNYHSKK